ncbi:hypothetical protein XBP1_900002 [Xenorhabdus bovienii str. puntauvense]|uniref:Uncharacterized protein n=1 Tax=Xenorhabdus bovienii str. puntauvense TaxID=1398201 RepID=A0A077NNP9_XENBV|nr:hypothetical protein XBP1_900002 [Xenorhabdus bovienii str. puntauvense]
MVLKWVCLKVEFHSFLVEVLKECAVLVIAHSIDLLATGKKKKQNLEEGKYRKYWSSMDTGRSRYF